MNPNHFDLKKQIEKASAILKNGGLVAYPTDTRIRMGACMTDTCRR